MEEDEEDTGDDLDSLEIETEPELPTPRSLIVVMWAVLLSVGAFGGAILVHVVWRIAAYAWVHSG